MFVTIFLAILCTGAFFKMAILDYLFRSFQEETSTIQVSMISALEKSHVTLSWIAFSLMASLIGILIGMMIGRLCFSVWSLDVAILILWFWRLITYFAWPLVAEKDRTISKVLDESLRLVKKRFWEIIGVALPLIVVLCIGLAPAAVYMAQKYSGEYIEVQTGTYRAGESRTEEELLAEMNQRMQSVRHEDQAKGVLLFVKNMLMYVKYDILLLAFALFVLGLISLIKDVFRVSFINYERGKSTGPIPAKLLEAR